MKCVLTLLKPQSRSGDKPVNIEVVLSPNGTAVLKGLKYLVVKYLVGITIKTTF